MVSVAGDYRTGKSFVLSKAFNQPNVFPLGHTMMPETVGIWLWIVPEKYKVRFYNYFPNNGIAKMPFFLSNQLR